MSLDFFGLKVVDLTRTALDAGTLFPGDHLSQIDFQTSNFSSGHICRVSKGVISLSSHAGTHADKPSHFMASPSYSDFDLETYSGPALVLDLTQYLEANSEITPAHLEQVLRKFEATKTCYRERVLVRTNSSLAYPNSPQQEFCFFSPDAIDFLAENGAKLIGIDTPSVDSIDRKDLSAGSHGKLYRRQVAVLENLNLGELSSCCGRLLTIFDPLRDFPDARGVASVTFLVE